MKPRRLPFTLATALALAIFAYGCASRLEPGGKYAPFPVVTTNATGQVNTYRVAPDIGLYFADSTFLLADASMKTVSKLEQDNRALLWKLNPGIKHKLDELRPQAWKAEKDYVHARRAYLNSPSPETLATLNGVGLKLQQLLAAAQVVMPDLSKPNRNP